MLLIDLYFFKEKLCKLHLGCFAFCFVLVFGVVFWVLLLFAVLVFF